MRGERSKESAEILKKFFIGFENEFTRYAIIICFQSWGFSPAANAGRRDERFYYVNWKYTKDGRTKFLKALFIALSPFRTFVLIVKMGVINTQRTEEASFSKLDVYCFEYLLYFRASCMRNL
jgi:hypothetical protein